MHLLLLILPLNIFQGVIWDTEKSLPVTNAYIYPVNKPYLSVVSNEEGVFVLPETISIDDSLEISHLSYQPKRIICKPGQSSSLDTIFLKPRSFELEEVHVYGETAFEIMKNCIRNLKRNHKNPTMYFKFQTALDTYDDDNVLQTIEDYDGILKLSQNGNIAVWLRNSRYHIKRNKHFDPSVYMISFGKIEFDPILRFKEDFLKRSKLDNYDWQYMGQGEQFGRKICIIRFQSNVGGYYDNGTLYIDTQNYAVLKISLYKRDGRLISEIVHVPYKETMILRTVYDYFANQRFSKERISHYQIIENPIEYLELKYEDIISPKKYKDVVEDIQKVDSFDQSFLDKRKQIFRRGRENSKFIHDGR